MYAMLLYNTPIHIYYRVTLGGSIELTGLSHTSWFFSNCHFKNIYRMTNVCTQAFLIYDKPKESQKGMIKKVRFYAMKPAAQNK